MKNKVSLLTLATAVALSACGAKNNEPKTEIKKIDITENLIKVPNGTKFVTSEDYVLFNQDNKDKKWQYQFKNDKGEKVSFGLDEFEKENDIFAVTKFKSSTMSGQNIKIKFKVPTTNLTYGHYVLNEFTLNIDGKELSSYRAFIAGQKDKEKFTKPAQKTIFEGSTHAVLTSVKDGKTGYDNLSGKATMEIAENKNFGDVRLVYGDKSLTAKNVNIDNGILHNKPVWEFKGFEDGFVEDKSKSFLNSRVFDNKEIIGAYRLNIKKEENTLQFDGGFGMKKQ